MGRMVPVSKKKLYISSEDIRITKFSFDFINYEKKSY